MIRIPHAAAKHDRPVVWVHGWGMNSAVWDIVPEACTPSACRLDLPGHGGRQWDARLGVRLEAWAEDLLQCAPNQAVWVGWSLGGLVALEVARRAPERVERLILVASAPRFLAPQQGGCGMALSIFEQFKQDWMEAPQRSLQRFLALQAVGAQEARLIRMRLEKAVLSAPPATVQALKAGLTMLEQTDLTSALAELKMPVHALLGERDRIVPPCVAQLYAQALPEAEIHIQPGAGHAPFLQAPELLGRWLTQA